MKAFVTFSFPYMEAHFNYITNPFVRARTPLYNPHLLFFIFFNLPVQHLISFWRTMASIFATTHFSNNQEIKLEFYVNKVEALIEGVKINNFYEAYKTKASSILKINNWLTSLSLW